MLSVGINASPLTAPRTGVGRYILGLLGGLAAVRASGRGSGDAFAYHALFAPAALIGEGPRGDAAAPAAGDAGAGEEPVQRAAPVRAGGPAARSLLGAARTAMKQLPFAYELAQAARAAVLEFDVARGRIGVYHETNHAAPRTRVPVVLTVHDLSTLLYPQTQERKRARYFARALRERAGDAARVIAPTQAIAEQVIALLGVPRERVRAVHHGVDAALLRALAQPAPPGPPPSVQRAGVSGSYLLFVGALEPRKGLPVLLDAVDALPEALARAFPLVLAGPPERIDGPLRERLARTRPGRLVQLGFVAPEALPALYRGAAALCLPSVYEGFGLPLLEALACGTPCAISDDPALVEVAGGAALSSPRGDAHALSASLRRLLEDPALQAALREQGLRRATQFSWEASARSHLAAYREALTA